MDDVQKWKAVYTLLDQVKVEVFDCGTLCSHACCVGRNMAFLPKVETDWETPVKSYFLSTLEIDEDEEEDNPKPQDELGIYLFPGEHLLLNEMEDTSWLEVETQDAHEIGFPDSWTGPVYFVKCKTPPNCPRKWRPLQCRTFPLKPIIDDNGVLELIWNDEELPYVCPLIEENAPIHDDFYRATYLVWSHLVKDPRIFDLVLSWS